MREQNLFGQFLLKHNAITKEQLSYALKVQLDSGISIGELALSKAMLTEDEVKRVLRSQWKTHQHFGEIAQSMKLLNKSQVVELLNTQKMFHMPLGEILIKEGHISRTELTPLLQQHKMAKYESKDVLPALKKVDLFSSLKVKELAQISLLLRIMTFDDEAIIYKEGDASEYLYLIESGTVEITMQSGTDRVDVNVLIDWNNFGLYSLLNRKPHVEMAKAIGKVTLWCLSWEDLHGLLVEYPSLSVTALKLLSGSIDDIVFSFCDEQEISDLYITAVIYDENIAHGRDYVNAIVKQTSADISGRTLLLECFGGTGADYSKQQILELLPLPMDERHDLYSMTLPRLIAIDDLKEVMRAQQRRKNNFSCIMILLSTQSTKLCREVITITKKSVMLLLHQIPELEQVLVSERDRMFFVQERPESINIDSYRDNAPLTSRFSVPSMFYLDGIDASVNSIARWLLCRTIGLTFGGGGARTITNVGILELFDEEGISFDFVSGTSGGALFGGLYAIGLNAQEIKQAISKSIEFGKDSPANDYNLTMKTIIKGKKYKRLLKRVFGERFSCGTRIPLYAIATDINCGREVIVNRCHLWEAVYVSSAIPGYSPLMEINGRLLGEGGLVNNVPSTVLKESGADLVISVNCSQDIARAPLTSTTLPSMFSRSLDILIQQSVQLRAHYTDIEIRPDIKPYGLFDFKKGMEMFDIGRVAALEHIDEIKAKIAALKNNPTNMGKLF